MTMTTSQEINEALKAVADAENRFNHCDADYLDQCIHELNAAKAHLSVVLKQRKLAA